MMSRYLEMKGASDCGSTVLAFLLMLIIYLRMQETGIFFLFSEFYHFVKAVSDCNTLSTSIVGLLLLLWLNISLQFFVCKTFFVITLKYNSLVRIVIWCIA